MTPRGGPEGLVYQPEFVSPEEEQRFLAAVRSLEFSPIKMRGRVARRRTAHFGWRYGYESWRIEPGPPLADFLLPLRDRAGALANVNPAELAEALVTEYPPGAGIGWHRDAPMFGVVIGVSLGAACRIRFRRGTAEGRLAWAWELEPRSAYVLTGSARSTWQHTIPPVKTARYSITFRTLRPTTAPSSGRRAPTDDVTGLRR